MKSEKRNGDGINMEKEDWNTALYKKMLAEQETYKEWLQQQPSEEILKHAYEYTVREDVLLLLEYENLTDFQAQALLKSPSPLGDVFSEYEKRETGYMEDLFDSVARRADAAIQAEIRPRHTKSETPVYPYSAEYAQKHGELEQYRFSHKANVACKEAIEAAIRGHYYGYRLEEAAVQEVIGAFGISRTMYVLANTVRHKRQDGPISQDNKAWAMTVPVCEDKDQWGHDHSASFVVETGNLSLTDIFISQARREQSRQATGMVEKKRRQGREIR